MKINRTFIVALLGLCANAFVWPSYAGGLFASFPCDAKYNESLRAQAWLNAQAEITQNQNLIFRTDSVLEYTCFSKRLNELADHGGPAGPDKLFTGNDRWGPPPSDLPAAMNDLLPEALGHYLSQNFNHTYLGGHTTAGPIVGPLPGPGAPPAPPPLSGPILTVVTPITPGDYSCSVMNDIWPIAKCMDFIDDPDTDGFYTFTQYALDPDDKRRSPCAKTADFATNINKATINADTPWTENAVVTYFELVYPAGNNCEPSSLPSGQATKVSTGLAITSGSATYTEHVCVVPGCHYEHTSNKCQPN